MPPVTMMEEYWKDDFRPLKDTALAVNAALKADETSPESDLYRRLANTGSGGTSQQQQTYTADEAYAQPHAYHYEKSNTTLTLKHDSTRPLPGLIEDAKKRMKRTTFMGVLSALGWAYMTVDSVIYIFSLESNTTGAPETLLSFENPRNQSILAAQLVKPRPGIFKRSVEYCLVVTTVEDVWLLALTQDEFNSWHCVPTSFVVASDGVRLSAIAGTETGRIFLGGDDGCLHEFVYESTAVADRKVSVDEQLEDFYNGTKDLPPVVTEQTAKRSWWQSLTSSSSPGSEPPHKARKLNRTRPSGGWLLSSSGGGSLSPSKGRVHQIVVDDERQTLSLLTTTGLLQVFDLRKGSTTHLAAECHLPETTRIYLEAVGRGQMYPPTTAKTGAHGRPVGLLRFPGAGPAAQAGVGGMNGARELLKATESGTTRRAGKQSSILLPAQIDVISCRESAHLTLLVVTHGGLRLYLSTLSSNVLNTGAVEASQLASFRRNPNASPLAPSSRVTLCHVRAPPSLRPSSKVSKPNTTALANWKVEASFHEHGQWLLALEESNNTGINVLVGAMPDGVARKVPEDDPKKSPSFQPSGGLAETVELPCDGATLVGGVVWDFCKLPSGTKGSRASALSDLVWRSPTPANANDVDIPPAYYPPSKLYRPSSLTAASGERRVAVPQQPASLRATAMHVMGQAFLNFMLSRSLSHGLAVPNVTNSQTNGCQSRVEVGNEYRLSTRIGARGFSSTAAEKGPARSSVTGSSRRTSSSGAASSSSSTSRSSVSTTRTPSRKVSISARLQQTLVRPMTIPLHHMATHHLVDGDSQIVALNALGVHTFSIRSVVSALAEAIMAAGERIADDETVDSFFKSYGYAEGCAMALALAIGCGPASGQFGYTEDLRRLSIRAVMARAYTPKIKLISSANGFSSDTIAVDAESGPDPFVPSGYEFRPSQLSQGLTRLFARLVRPVWNKPVVVVTEGRSVKLQWSHGNKITPAKVELLLDDETLKDVRAPLESLQHLAKDVFKRAIEQVPGTVQRQDAMMDIDEGLNTPGSSILTQSLHYKHSVRTGSVGAASEVNQKDAETIAHLIEERNIHSLYRLLCRVVQLLQLVSLLRKADSMPELPQVDWGLLHGLTFSQMVQSPEGQERLETLLNSLVVASASSASSLSYSNEADGLARLFAENCYLFFPPASRFAYQGIRCAMEALDSAPASIRRRELTGKAASNLIDAAKHWYSATLISGRLLRSRGNETREEIVARAVQHGSPLAKAADLLVQLEDVASVVEICLLTASNFHSRRTAVHARDVRELSGVFGWELDLYHKHRDVAQNDPTGAVNSPRSPDSYSASVSGKDAIDTCYAVVLYHLSSLFRSNKTLADKMLSACTAYTDKEFLKELFQFLLDNNNADVLLRISSTDVEKWLQERNDPDLLWRYYDVQGKKLQSGKVSFGRATSKDAGLSIEERIESLTRASNSLKSAARDTTWQTGDASNEDANRLARKIEDALTVAKIQHRIMNAIASFSDLPTEISAEKMTELSTTLLDVSSLYELAASIPLTDMCLVIFHRCRQQDTQTIRMLWTTLFSELLLPMSTENEDVFQVLTELASSVRFDEDKVEKLTGTVNSGKGYSRFEDGGWIADFENKIKSLGNELYGTGADYTFPVDFLMAFLETLRKACPRLLSFGWSLKVLAGAGVPYLVLLDSYRDMSVRDGADDLSVKDGLAAQLDLLDFWLTQCNSAGELASVAKQELSRAKATGEVQSHVDFLYSKISVTPGTQQELLPSLDSIEQRLQYVF